MIYNLFTYIISSTLSDAIADALGAAFLLIAIILGFGILFLIGIVSLITWIVKKIWFHQPRKNKRSSIEYREDDWMSQAQHRQNMRYEYLDPYNPRKNNVQTKRNNFKENSEDNPKWYPTGWTYNEETQLWEPPSQKKR